MCGEKPTPDSAFCVRLWTPEHLNVLSELKVYMIATKLSLQETSLCDISSLSPSIRERKAPQSKGFQYFNKDTSLILVGLTFFNKFAQLHRDCTAVSLHLLEPINQCMPISQQTSASIEHFLWRTWCHFGSYKLSPLLSICITKLFCSYKFTFFFILMSNISNLLHNVTFPVLLY